jgi:hypothetical protein
MLVALENLLVVVKALLHVAALQDVKCPRVKKELFAVKVEILKKLKSKLFRNLLTYSTI